MRNLDIKTRFDDLDLACRLAREIGAQDAGTSRDVDTYFRVPHGRLKLRRSESTRDGTLIHYHRPDQATSRYSEYHLASTSDPERTREVLSAALGVLVTVAKTRRLLLYGDTRIHLDHVDGLGCFVELETVMRGQTEEAHAEHQRGIQGLGLDRQEVVADSYSDLLLSSQVVPE